MRDLELRRSRIGIGVLWRLIPNSATFLSFVFVVTDINHLIVFYQINTPLKTRNLKEMSLEENIILINCVIKLRLLNLKCAKTLANQISCSNFSKLFFTFNYCVWFLSLVLA